MRRVSIEPEKNLTFHTTPCQPVAELALVVASPAVNGNLRGRGRQNVIWMHLQCIEKCISFLKVDYTMASFAHRVHHEERGMTFRLDTESIERIENWKSDPERNVLNNLFKTFNSFKAEASEEVNYHTLRQSYSLQYLAIYQQNDSFRGNFRRRRRYLRYRQDV